MKKTMSRIISALLVVAMVCAMIPAALAAEPTTPTVKMLDGTTELTEGAVIKVKAGESKVLKATGADDYYWQRAEAAKAFAKIDREPASAATAAQIKLTGTKAGEFELYVCEYDRANDVKTLDNKSATIKVVVTDEITSVVSPAAGSYTITQDEDGKFDFSSIENVKATGKTSKSGDIKLDVNWTDCEFNNAAEVMAYEAEGTVSIPADKADLYTFSSDIPTKTVKLKVEVKTAPKITNKAPTTTLNVSAGAKPELKVEEIKCEGAALTYQWKKGTTVLVDETAVPADGKVAYTVPAEDTTAGANLKYTLVIKATKDGATTSKEIEFTVKVAKAVELKLTIDGKSSATIDVDEEATLKATLYKDGVATKPDTATRVKFEIVDKSDKSDTNWTQGYKQPTMGTSKSYVTCDIVGKDENNKIEIVATMTYEGEELESNVVTLKIDEEDDDEDYEYYIEYDAESGDEFNLDADDFEDILNDEYRNDDLDYVKFQTGSATKYTSAYARIYEGSKNSDDLISSSTKYDLYDLDDLEVRVSSSSSKYTTIVPFTIYGEGTHKVYGALYIYVNGGGKNSTGAGDVNYYVDADDEVSFDADDFEEYLQDKYSSQDLEYVKFFVDEDATKYGGSYGEIYEGSKSSDDEIYETKYDYDEVDDMEFRAGSKSTEYIVKVPFTVYGETKDVDGDLYIYVNYDEDDDEDGTGYVAANGETLKAIGVVAFLKDDISSSKLKKTHVEFSVSGGTLYTDKSEDKKATSSTEFYFVSGGNGDYDVEDAFLVPNSTASKVTLKYSLYYNNSKQSSGTITLKVEDAKEKTTFTDIPADVAKWASEGIEYLYEEGIINGTGGTKFSPNANMTRADFVVMLYRVAGEPSVSGIKNPFADVVSGKYYYNAVLWANDKGIVNGKDTNKFAPNDNITRQQIAAILYRYAGSPATTGTLNAFSDKGTVDPYAQNALKWAVAQGIVNGSNGMLLPKANATRAQVAVMLYRYIVK